MRALLISLALMIVSVGFAAENPAVRMWADGAGFRMKTSYSYPASGIALREDSIHVFFRSQKGRLTASSQTQAVFQWDSLHLNNGNLEFVPFKSDVNVLSSSCTDLPAAYYRVRIQSAESQDTLGAWICIDTMRFTAIQVLNNSCENLQLKPTTFPSADGYSRYFYYDLGLFPVPYRKYIPRSNSPYISKAVWTSSKEIHPNIDNADESWKTRISPYISGPAPLADAVYTVTLTNVFGDTMTRSTEVIPAKAAYASFQINSTQELTAFADTLRGEAPLPLSFNGTYSQNATEYNWKGFRGMASRRIGAVLPDLWWQESAFSNVNRIDAQAYMVTDKFPIQLRVSNEYGCTDSLIRWVRVDSSLFDQNLIPNLFTPNSDGKNDFFKLKNDKDEKLRSIRTLEVSVYNRNGERVFSSNKIDFSWNGKASGTNFECPSGVYFWVIRATGYDEKKYKGKEYRGLVHLFR